MIQIPAFHFRLGIRVCVLDLTALPKNRMMFAKQRTSKYVSKIDYTLGGLPGGLSRLSV